MQKSQELPSAFAALGIEKPLLRAIAKLGFVEPSDIQTELIPLIIAGNDVMGQARTGTGKTAAFGLPIMQRIDTSGRLQALVLVPTRELAVQVAGELRRMSTGADLHILAVYGGERISKQAHSLGKKPHVVVGTPGRVMDFMRRGNLDIANIQFAVLDEVDRMLDIGFRDDIRQILSAIESEHQTVFVSATLSDDIKRLAKRFMTDPKEINVSQDELTVEGAHQTFVTVEPWDKFRAMRMLMETEDPKLAIIFTNTKHAARKLTRKLHDAGIDAREIHGDLVQQKREHVMEQFRKHKLRVLVATDLAARGIDVNGISHIINYDIPPDPEVYVHRIGRTARMGTFGRAITFVTTEQGKELTQVEQLINKQVEQENIKGFEPSPPPREFGEPDTAATGFSAGVTEGVEVEEVKAKPQRLGGRFRRTRRRRL